MLQDIPEFLTDGTDGERRLDPKAVTTLGIGEEEAGDHRGEIFGEIAALSRTPRSASVLAAEGGAVLLEIGWKGLNDIRKYSPGWKRMIDEQYRATSLVTHLRNAEYTRHLGQAPQVPAGKEGGRISEFEHVAEHTKFHSYGEFEWKESFKEMAEGGSGDSEPVIARQGSFADELILIRAGFARLTRRYNHGEKTVAYLGKGQAFGFAEIYHNGKRSDGGDGSGEPMHYQYTLRAVGYVDTLAIPAPLVEDFIVPKLSSEEKREIEAELARLRSGDDAPLFDPGGDAGGKLLEFFVEQRAINGNAAMFIDLDRCTRCDDCVRACADTHGGDPRFIRHGPETAGIQLTHACMHCVDPVCMIGCPTGAIHRDPVGDQVVINEYSCIGCSMCANNCPYDNIQMVELRDEEGEFLAKSDPVGGDVPGGKKAVSGDSGDPVPGTADAGAEAGAEIGAADRSAALPGQVLGWERRATKCDLCVDQLTGPACFQACPHDALIRADMAHPAPLIKWLERR